MVDAEAIAQLGAGLRCELAYQPEALALTDRCLIVPLPVATCLVVFLDIAAIDLLP